MGLKVRVLCVTPGTVVGGMWCGVQFLVMICVVLGNPRTSLNILMGENKDKVHVKPECGYQGPEGILTNVS